ncbi:hypothetical protein SAMN04489761_1172 [Tenacibaculum sp. MAR_2009_124]|uniref:hypothetical protein n=1 Tax=Tenacibaculum sp. MAR_2009_124 TaxID=1250059 RepID=UPI000894BA09|nr:hypothetical protein [Tenacibaculum sp. MAR_2009_124]SEB51824.1 hypothetical protein SAMN04489761_1172 [Tenacibaculum sp. MAR_2009_124]
MKNKYKIGDIVFAIAKPHILLEIRIYARKIYYCTIKNDPLGKELVYFERELKPYEVVV